MARSRAERRHNTYIKTSARKAKAIRGEIDQFPAHGVAICGNKISLNGEAASCNLCITAERWYSEKIRHYQNLQIDSFMKSIAE